MRTFIAIDLDSDIKKNISDLVRRLKKLAPQNVGWVKEKGMHLTLKFLGDVEDSRLAPIQKLIRDVAGAFKTFPLRLQGMGFFPPAARFPRVIWIGTSQPSSLMGIHERIESGLEKLEFPREGRLFHPHLTLGRVKNPSGLHDLIAECVKNCENEFGEMIVKKITLFKSTLKPTGAEYSVLEEGPLS